MNFHNCCDYIDEA